MELSHSDMQVQRATLVHTKDRNNKRSKADAEVRQMAGAKSSTTADGLQPAPSRRTDRGKVKHGTEHSCCISPLRLIQRFKNI